MRASGMLLAGMLTVRCCLAFRPRALMQHVRASRTRQQARSITMSGRDRLALFDATGAEEDENARLLTWCRDADVSEGVAGRDVCSLRTGLCS
eukprot:767958-Hanusia_phi.AAC.2